MACGIIINNGKNNVVKKDKRTFNVHKMKVDKTDVQNMIASRKIK